MRNPSLGIVSGLILLCASASAWAASVYVGNGYGDVHEVELGSGASLGTLPTFGDSLALGLLPGATLYAGGLSTDITEIDLGAGLPVGTIPAPFPVMGMDVADDGSLWVGSTYAFELANVDPMTGVPLDSIPLFHLPYSDVTALALDPGGGFAIAAGPLAEIFLLDPAGALLHSFMAPMPAVGGLSYTPGGSLLVGGGFEIWELDPTSGAAIGAPTPSPIAVESLAFVPEPGTGLLLTLGLGGLAIRQRV